MSHSLFCRIKVSPFYSLLVNYFYWIIISSAFRIKVTHTIHCQFICIGSTTFLEVNPHSYLLVRTPWVITNNFSEIMVSPHKRNYVFLTISFKYVLRRFKNLRVTKCLNTIFLIISGEITYMCDLLKAVETFQQSFYWKYSMISISSQLCQSIVIWYKKGRYLHKKWPKRVLFDEI